MVSTPSSGTPANSAHSKVSGKAPRDPFIASTTRVATATCSA